MANEDSCILHEWTGTVTKNVQKFGQNAPELAQFDDFIKWHQICLNRTGHLCIFYVSLSQIHKSTVQINLQRTALQHFKVLKTLHLGEIRPHDLLFRRLGTYFQKF
jgi:hypothetical protein